MTPEKDCINVTNAESNEVGKIETIGMSAGNEINKQEE